MRRFSRCIRSLLALTVLASCSVGDSISRPETDITADGNRIAQPTGIDNPSSSSFAASIASPSVALNTATSSTTISSAATPNVAILTIFADPTYSLVGSSGLQINEGTHAFITVMNISSSPITVGKLGQIQPKKTVSIGTWGNQKEHAGVWYNLEAYSIYKQGAYAKRVSLANVLSSSQLTTLNSFISSHDSYFVSPLQGQNNNCATFAAGAWNAVVESYSKLSAGLPDSPKNLASSIKSKTSAYGIGASVPYDYLVYYANGSGAPGRSTVYK